MLPLPITLILPSIERQLQPSSAHNGIKYTLPSIEHQLQFNGACNGIKCHCPQHSEAPVGTNFPPGPQVLDRSDYFLRLMTSNATARMKMTALKMYCREMSVPSSVMPLVRDMNTSAPTMVLVTLPTPPETATPPM